MHVAAAVGLPVVAVFGPTDPFGTAPVTRAAPLFRRNRIAAHVSCDAARRIIAAVSAIAPEKVSAEFCERSRRFPLPEKKLRPAVFLDRDGTITEEVGYLNHISRFRLLDGVARRFGD